MPAVCLGVVGGAQPGPLGEYLRAAMRGWIGSDLTRPCSPWPLRLTDDHPTLPEAGHHASGHRLRRPSPRGLDLLVKLGHLEAWQEPTRTKPQTLYIVNPKSAPPAGARL